MLNLLTKLVMLASFATFALFGFDDWGGQMLGWHNDIWQVLDLPWMASSAPNWIVALGAASTVVALACLAFAYMAVWIILDGGIGQDFRLLARRLRWLAAGLTGFWLFSNLPMAVLRPILAGAVALPGQGPDLYWDPFNPDLVLAIVSVALLAISRMMERAWQAEDENRHFL